MVDRSINVIKTQSKKTPNILKKTLSKTEGIVNMNQSLWNKELDIPELYDESDIDALNDTGSNYLICNNDKYKAQSRNQTLGQKKDQPAFEMILIKDEPPVVKHEVDVISVSDSDDDVIIKKENLNAFDNSCVKVKNEPKPDEFDNHFNGELIQTAHQTNHSVSNELITEDIPSLSNITKKEIEIINVFTVLSCMNCSSIERLIDKALDNLNCTACCSKMNHQCNLCKKVFSNLSFIYLHLLKKHIQFTKTIADKKKNEVTPSQDKKTNFIMENSNLNEINHNRKGNVNYYRQYNPEGYKCKKCNKWYSREIYLTVHEQSCLMVPNLCCKFCPSRLSFKSQLRLHMIEDHKQDFQIEDLEDILDSIINDSKKLRDMQDLILGCCTDCKIKIPVGCQQIRCHICETDLIYQCGVVECSETYSTVNLLIEHTRSDHANLSGVCEMCNDLISGREELVRHRIACPDSVYICTHCPYRSASTNELEHHARSVHFVIAHERTIQCNRCEKIFDRFEQLEIHDKSDCLGQILNCAHCSFTASDKNSLLIHLRCAHVKIFTGKLPSCHKCGNKWPNVFKLYNHVDDCSGDYELEKAKIMKKSKLEQSENETAKTQEVKPEYEKSDWPSSDERAQKLMNIYCVNCNERPNGVDSKEGICLSCELPYINRCWECGKDFSRWYMLLVHVNRKHGPDKLYGCWGCAKSFYMHDDAKKHEAVCAKLAAYEKAGVPKSCGNCGNSYSRAAMMLTHVKYCGKGQKVLYKCDHCGWTFKNKLKLVSHIRDLHAELSLNGQQETTFKV